MASIARPDPFTGFLLELLAPLGPVSARRMFGGVGLYRGETMFGLIVRGELFLKVGEGNRAEFEASGQAPFSYETRHGRHTIASYWSCPPELLDEPDEMRRWAGKAMAAASAVVRPKPRSPARRPRAGPAARR